MAPGATLAYSIEFFFTHALLVRPNRVVIFVTHKQLITTCVVVSRGECGGVGTRGHAGLLDRPPRLEHRHGTHRP